MNLKPRISASRKEVGSVDSSASLNANEYRCEVRVMTEGMFVTTHAFVVCAMKHRNAVLVMDAFILKMEGQTSKYRQVSARIKGHNSSKRFSLVLVSQLCYDGRCRWVHRYWHR
jgi:hypothetical protein